MAHYAKINNDNIVQQVIVAEKDFINNLPDKDKWIQTSYNTKGGIHYSPITGRPDNGLPLRKNYAGIGFTYDKELDAFIPPKPYASWVLNKKSCLWEPPIKKPESGDLHWDEENKKWKVEIS